MKKILIAILLLSSYQMSFANEACRYLDPEKVSTLNDQVYGIIAKPYVSLENDIDKLIYTNAIYTKVSHLQDKYTNDLARCTISGILYRLNGNKLSLARQLENISQQEFDNAPTEIQSQIEASKKSIY